MATSVHVAPMVDITTRHFRYLMRLMTKRTVLWTPMFYARRIAARKQHAVDSMLRFHPAEGAPVAQLGGDDLKALLAAGRRCQRLGYSEVNLNLGCPADSAKKERFGAMLMLPCAHDRVVAALRAMTSELSIPVSVKVRIGVDEHDSYQFFRDFVMRMHEVGGVDRFVVHARKALLAGLPSDSSAGLTPRGAGVNTRQNRADAIVPLRHEFVERLKREQPALQLVLNGGLRSHAAITAAAATCGVDGVMLGRLARDDPWFFASVDSVLFGDEDAFAGLPPLEARLRVIEQYADYCETEQVEQQPGERACAGTRAHVQARARTRTHPPHTDATPRAQVGGHEGSREMLLKPLNQLLHGLKEKALLGSLLRVRAPPDGRKRLFADELRDAVRVLRSSGAMSTTLPSGAPPLMAAPAPQQQSQPRPRRLPARQRSRHRSRRSPPRS